MRIAILLVLLILFTGCSAEGQAEKESAPAVKQSLTPDSTFTSNGAKMLGEKGRLGFIYGDRVTFEAGDVNKYMWHFWGTEKELDGPVKIVAINETGEKHKVLVNGIGSDGPVMVWKYEAGVAGSNNGADAHMPSNMVLPSSGIWKLKVYIGGEYFGDVSVEVEGSGSNRE